jgi:phytoene/squalene synthetase
VDLPRRRYYLPRNWCLQYGVQVHAPSNPALIAHGVHAARQLLLSGQSLVHHIPGRAGWELRLVVQGGLRILDKIEAIHYNTVQIRPTLRWWDIPILLWRAWRM